ncbi:MAG: purine nucleoside permease [Gammaproteobacteria bacterium]|nr:purine nucleoside permease [Gammaproteobacteria bacterium]
MRLVIFFVFFFLGGCESSQEKQKGLVQKVRPVKVVIVTMLEIGEDLGDRRGELQIWREGREFAEVLPFQGYKDLYYNEQEEVLLMVTGIGTARAAAAIMAVGMDQRFDLSLAYWVIAGIAGIDPEDGTLGSAVWAEYLVDGDLGHHIDAREMPEDWPFGYFPRHTNKPFDSNKPEPTGEMYRLNSDLTDWAFQLTKDIQLPDDESLVEERLLYTNHPQAQGSPKVMKGDHIAALTFWHGALLNDWANRLVDYWTEGDGNMVTSGMEDTGSYLSLKWLDGIGRADKDRVMVLRTGSNFTMQPPSRTAAENLLRETSSYKYAGLEVALESGYLVGSKVVYEIVHNWNRYRDGITSLAEEK